MNGPLLWFVNRGSGVALLALLSVVVVLGTVSTWGSAGGRAPRFLVQSLHRNLALLGVLMLAAHVTSAVVDTYVDIRWWQALVPVGATYRPVWLELGTWSLDIIVVVTATSLLRTRLGHRSWRIVHLAAYAAWGLALVHGYRIGTDAGQPWTRWVDAGCIAAVVFAATARLVSVLLRPHRLRTAPVDHVGAAS